MFYCMFYFTCDRSFREQLMFVVMLVDSFDLVTSASSLLIVDLTCYLFKTHITTSPTIKVITVVKSYIYT